ncbi:MAG: hypothetical protein RR946_10000, partial [Clostridia bacterium]
MKRLAMVLAIALVACLLTTGTLAIYSTQRQITGNVEIGAFEIPPTPTPQKASLAFAAEAKLSIAQANCEYRIAEQYVTMDEAAQTLVLHATVELLSKPEGDAFHLQGLVAELTVANHCGTTAYLNSDSSANPKMRIRNEPVAVGANESGQIAVSLHEDFAPTISGETVQTAAAAYQYEYESNVDGSRIAANYTAS